MTLAHATRLMCLAARELAADEVLCDPSDDEILVAAAELAEGCDRVDLLALSDNQRAFITQAYDNVASATALMSR